MRRERHLAILAAVSRIIAVANQRTGVGKTSTVINLGAALAEAGHPVILIDLDPQSALTSASGLDPYHLTLTTYDLLTRAETDLQGIIRPLVDGTWLAPASVDLTAAEYMLTRSDDHAQRLRRALRGGANHAQFVLIDTPPRLGSLTLGALAAADELLIPVECQQHALQGIQALLKTVDAVRAQSHPGLKLLGVVLTLYQPDSARCQKVVQEFRSGFKDRVFETMIEDDEAVAMAPAARKPVLSFRPSSPAAMAYRRLAAEICATAPG